MRLALLLSSLVLVALWGDHRLAVLAVVAALLVAEHLTEAAQAPQYAALIDASGAIAAVVLGGAAAAPLLLLPATRVRRHLSAWASGFSLLAASVYALVLAADSEPDRWARYAAVVLLPLSGLIMLLDPVFGRARVNARLAAMRELDIRRARLDRVVAGAAHDDLSGVTNIVEDTSAFLRRAGDSGSLRVSMALDSLLAACHRARSGIGLSEFPDFPDPSDEASSFLVDRWGRSEKAPTWWPETARQAWAVSVGSWLDSIRHLHTREIERVALIGTLVLRAALILVMPLTASLLLAGLTPTPASTTTWRDAIWIGVASWASICAAVALPLADRAMDATRTSFRTTMFASESILAAALLLGVPSWISLTFLAGPVNWLMRPRWSLRRLMALVSAAAAVLAGSLLLTDRDVTSWRIVAEILLGLAALFVISCSFGLMFPLVLVYAVLVIPSWSIELTRLRRQRWKERLGPLIAEFAGAVAIAHEERERSAAVAEVEPQLQRARLRLEAMRAPRQHRKHRPFLGRRTLHEVVTAGLDRARRDPVRPLRCATPEYVPLTLRNAEMASWRLGNHLEIAVGRMAAEAVRHGDFEVRSRWSLDPDEAFVHVHVENDVPMPADAQTGRGEGRGGREIEAAVSQLPGGRVAFRGPLTNELGIPVFAVHFLFDAAALRRRQQK